MRPLSTTSSVLLLILATGVAGCSSDDSTGPAPGSVSGTVTSPDFGPLGDVTVTAAPGGRSGTTEPVTGEYSIDGLTPGDYTLALGELPEGCTDPGPRAVTVPDNAPAVVHFTVACTPPGLGAISGTVTSPELGLLGDVTVTASPAGVSGVSGLANGAYTIDDLTPGDYTLELSGLRDGCADPGSQAASVAAGGNTTVDFTVSCSLRRLYASSFAGNTVSILAAGEVEEGPIGTLGGPSTGLDAPAGLAIDQAGRLYVSNAFLNSITVYSPNSTGDAAPIATIAGPGTGLASPSGLALDAEGRLYVINNAGNSITVYAQDADGDAAPVATIAGPSTTLEFPASIALDSDGRIYVPAANDNRVRIFAAGASGDVAPIATIEGADTELEGPTNIAVDAGGRIYVTNSVLVSVVVFAPGTSGNVAPLATLSGEDTRLCAVQDIKVDGDGQIYVVQQEDCVDESLLVFPSGANGNVSPIMALELSSPSALALESDGAASSRSLVSHAPGR